jgi:putative transposase
MEAANGLMKQLGITPALVALGLSPATFYRRQKPCDHASEKLDRPHPRALSALEEQSVLAVLHSERFVDRAPAQIVATLLSEQQYLCSERTMYRVLANHQEVRERRNQRVHPKYQKPELMATAPNQVWSWDITKLRTFVKFVYLYLYVIMDIYSRFVVGWMLAQYENGAYARRLIEETYDKWGVSPNQLVLHSDRGSPMKSKTVAQLLSDLDVDPSFSRPHVSDDNPFSESQFKTLKYHPSFPGKFTGMHDGLAHLRSFFPWYNNSHRHSGLLYLTPADVHFGRAEQMLAARHATKEAAYRATPQRFVKGPPRPQSLPNAVWINPPAAIAAEAPLGPSEKPLGVRGPEAPGMTIAEGTHFDLEAPDHEISPAAGDAPRPPPGARGAPQQSPILLADARTTASACKEKQGALRGDAH